MILALLLVTRPLMAQGGAGRERVLQVARDLVKGAAYATFVIIDGAGTPAARIVLPRAAHFRRDGTPSIPIVSATSPCCASIPSASKS